MGQEFIVTYTSIDNKVRECYWEYKFSDVEEVVSAIRTFLETNEWTDKKYDKPSGCSWGYLRADAFGWGKGIKCYSPAEHAYYKYLLTDCVIYNGLAQECYADGEFASAILKAATKAEKDRNNYDYDLLIKTKNRIRHHNKKEDDIREFRLVPEYTSLIQEFKLFKILDIQPCEDDFEELTEE